MEVVHTINPFIPGVFRGPGYLMLLRQGMLPW
jgi:hypothetical protein